MSAEDRGERVKSICLEALEREGVARAAYLDARCAGDADLRREVESLLEGESALGGFLAVSPGGGAVTPLPLGTHLGPYRLDVLIGAGGMGVVYKAHDTRLGREVAVKILPAQLAGDPERLRRFAEEGKTIAALSHPHICALFDVGEAMPSGGSPIPDPRSPIPSPVSYLVMEYLQGETLANRLWRTLKSGVRRPRLSPDEVLTIGSQVADGLAAAHGLGIVHRDLKPSNVMLTPLGAKLLDFGLARQAPGPTSAVPDEPLSGETREIVGTPPYMAPEQLQGQPADQRTDIWALGCVLYQLAAGRPAFSGSTDADVAAAVLDREPPALADVAPAMPPGLGHVIEKCLVKDPSHRWDSAHDVAEELRWLRETAGARTVASVGPRRRSVVRVLPWVAAGLCLLALGAGLMRMIEGSRKVIRTSLDVRPAEEVTSWNIGPRRLELTPGGTHTALAWIPGRRALAYIGRRSETQQIYVRDLDRDEATPLKGTEGAQALAVSPDGRLVAFWANRALKKVDLATDLVTPIALNEGIPYGLAWDDRSNLYVGRAADRRLYRIPPGRGLEDISQPDDYVSGVGRHILPSALPGGDWLLYTLRKRHLFGWGDEEIVAQELATNKRKILLTNAADARYVPPGYLLFMRQGSLWGVRFDAGRAETVGEPQLLLAGVSQDLLGFTGVHPTGAGQFAVSSDGTLAWLPGPVEPTYPLRTLVWLDRRGNVSPVAGLDPGPYSTTVRLSPDGTQAVIGRLSLKGERIHVWDLVRGWFTPMTDEQTSWLLWSWDGRNVWFRLIRKGRYSLAWQSRDGIGGPVVLEPPNSMIPWSWASPSELGGMTAEGDLAVARVDQKPAKVNVLARTSETELCPRFSPDGGWVAYPSNQSGRYEIYVQPYPGGREDRIRVSNGGGISPVWSKNGRELFFVRGSPRQLMVVDFKPGRPPKVSLPRELFAPGPDLTFDCTPHSCFDVHPDGRFITVTFQQPPVVPITHIELVENWLEDLKTRMRSGG